MKYTKSNIDAYSVMSLVNLAYNNDAKTIIAKTALNSIFSMLSSENRNTSLFSYKLLSLLGAYEMNRNQVIEQGKIDLLLQLSRTPDVLCKRFAAQALSDMAGTNKWDIATAVDVIQSNHKYSSTGNQYDVSTKINVGPSGGTRPSSLDIIFDEKTCTLQEDKLFIAYTQTEVEAEETCILCASGSLHNFKSLTVTGDSFWLRFKVESLQSDINEAKEEDTWGFRFYVIPRYSIALSLCEKHERAVEELALLLQEECDPDTQKFAAAALGKLCSKEAYRLKIARDCGLQELLECTKSIRSDVFKAASEALLRLAYDGDSFAKILPAVMKSMNPLVLRWAAFTFFRLIYKPFKPRTAAIHAEETPGYSIKRPYVRGENLQGEVVMEGAIEIQIVFDSNSRTGGDDAVEISDYYTKRPMEFPKDPDNPNAGNINFKGDFKDARPVQVKGDRFLWQFTSSIVYDDTKKIQSIPRGWKFRAIAEYPIAECVYSSVKYKATSEFELIYFENAHKLRIVFDASCDIPNIQDALRFYSGITQEEIRIVAQFSGDYSQFKPFEYEGSRLWFKYHVNSNDYSGSWAFSVYPIFQPLSEDQVKKNQQILSKGDTLKHLISLSHEKGWTQRWASTALAQFNFSRGMSSSDLVLQALIDLARSDDYLTSRQGVRGMVEFSPESSNLMEPAIIDLIRSNDWEILHNTLWKLSEICDKNSIKVSSNDLVYIMKHINSTNNRTQKFAAKTIFGLAERDVLNRNRLAKQGLNFLLDLSRGRDPYIRNRAIGVLALMVADGGENLNGVSVLGLNNIVSLSTDESGSLFTLIESLLRSKESITRESGVNWDSVIERARDTASMTNCNILHNALNVLYTFVESNDRYLKISSLIALIEVAKAIWNSQGYRIIEHLKKLFFENGHWKILISEGQTRSYFEHFVDLVLETITVVGKKSNTRILLDFLSDMCTYNGKGVESIQDCIESVLEKRPKALFPVICEGEEFKVSIDDNEEHRLFRGLEAFYLYEREEEVVAFFNSTLRLYSCLCLDNHERSMNRIRQLFSFTQLMECMKWIYSDNPQLVGNTGYFYDILIHAHINTNPLRLGSPIELVKYFDKPTSEKIADTGAMLIQKNMFDLLLFVLTTLCKLGDLSKNSTGLTPNLTISADRLSAIFALLRLTHVLVSYGYFEKYKYLRVLIECLKGILSGIEYLERDQRGRKSSQDADSMLAKEKSIALNGESIDFVISIVLEVCLILNKIWDGMIDVQLNNTVSFFKSHYETERNETAQSEDATTTGFELFQTATCESPIENNRGNMRPQNVHLKRQQLWDTVLNSDLDELYEENDNNKLTQLLDSEIYRDDSTNFSDLQEKLLDIAVLDVDARATEACISLVVKIETHESSFARLIKEVCILNGDDQRVAHEIEYLIKRIQQINPKNVVYTIDLVSQALREVRPMFERSFRFQSLVTHLNLHDTLYSFLEEFEIHKDNPAFVDFSCEIYRFLVPLVEGHPQNQLLLCHPKYMGIVISQIGNGLGENDLICRIFSDNPKTAPYVSPRAINKLYEKIKELASNRQLGDCVDSYIKSMLSFVTFPQQNFELSNQEMAKLDEFILQNQTLIGNKILDEIFLEKKSLVKWLFSQQIDNFTLQEKKDFFYFKLEIIELLASCCRDNVQIRNKCIQIRHLSWEKITESLCLLEQQYKDRVERQSILAPYIKFIRFAYLDERYKSEPRDVRRIVRLLTLEREKSQYDHISDVKLVRVKSIVGFRFAFCGFDQVMPAETGESDEYKDNREKLNEEGFDLSDIPADYEICPVNLAQKFRNKNDSKKNGLFIIFKRGGVRKLTGLEVIHGKNPFALKPPDGYEMINVDCNEGYRGDYVYVCTKYSETGCPIIEIDVKEGQEPIEHFSIIKKNINQGVEDSIELFLRYRNSNFNSVVGGCLDSAPFDQQTAKFQNSSEQISESSGGIPSSLDMITDFYKFTERISSKILEPFSGMEDAHQNSNQTSAYSKRQSHIISLFVDEILGVDRSKSSSSNGNSAVSNNSYTGLRSLIHRKNGYSALLQEDIEDSTSEISEQVGVTTNTSGKLPKLIEVLTRKSSYHRDAYIYVDGASIIYSTKKLAIETKQQLQTQNFSIQENDDVEKKLGVKQNNSLMAKMILCLLTHHNREISTRALELGNLILEGDARDIQMEFFNALSNDGGHFLESIDDILQDYMDEGGFRDIRGDLGRDEANFIVLTLKFIQRLCEGHYTEMQDLLCGQYVSFHNLEKSKDSEEYLQDKKTEIEQSSRNVQLVERIVVLLNGFISDIRFRQTWLSDDNDEKLYILDVLTQIIRTLTELLQGPRKHSQQILVESRIFEIIKNCIDIVEYEEKWIVKGSNALYSDSQNNPTMLEAIRAAFDKLFRSAPIKKDLSTQKQLIKSIQLFHANFLSLVSAVLEENTSLDVISQVTTALSPKILQKNYRKNWSIYHYSEESLNSMQSLSHSLAKSKRKNETEFNLEDIQSQLKNLKFAKEFLSSYTHMELEEAARARKRSLQIAFNYYSVMELVVRNITVMLEDSQISDMNQKHVFTQWKAMWTPIEEDTTVLEYFGCIELVNQNGSLQRTYFIIPDSAREQINTSVVRKERDNILDNVRRDSPEDKLIDFTDRMRDLIEMIRYKHDLVSKSKFKTIVKFLFNNADWWLYISYMAAAIINIVLLLNVREHHNEEYSFMPFAYYEFVECVGVVQILFGFLLVLNYWVGQAPIIVSKGWKSHQKPKIDGLYCKLWVLADKV